jgi:hypothetical protein
MFSHLHSLLSCRHQHRAIQAGHSCSLNTVHAARLTSQYGIKTKHKCFCAKIKKLMYDLFMANSK